MCAKEGSTSLSVSLVSCSDGATVCATDTGDIYLLSQYVCRKITRSDMVFVSYVCLDVILVSFPCSAQLLCVFFFPRIKSLSRLIVFGGQLDKEFAQEVNRKPLLPHDLVITLLDTKGMVSNGIIN